MINIHMYIYRYIMKEIHIKGTGLYTRKWAEVF